MKKSEMYTLAQKAVLNSQSIVIEDKLAVLRELMHKEDIEKYAESNSAEGNAYEIV